jgi:hypothetical protein
MAMEEMVTQTRMRGRNKEEEELYFVQSDED